MPLNCPIKTSKEWQDIFARANGDEELAYQMWENEGYGANEELNEFEEPEAVETEELGGEESNELSGLMKNVKQYLLKQMDELKKRKIKNQKAVVAKYRRIYNDIKTAEGIDSINLFVTDAYDKFIQAEKRLTALLAQPKADKKELLDDLTTINDFATSYNTILDQISKEDIYKYFTKKEEEVEEEQEEGAEKKPKSLTAQQMLTEALAARERIKNKFVQEGIPLMAKTLAEYKSDMAEERLNKELEALNKQLEEVKATKSISDKAKATKVTELEDTIAKYQSYLLDQKALEETLRIANEDEGILDFLISPLISSEDSALALFAKLVKSKFEDARMKDIEALKETSAQFETYAAVAGAGRDNAKAFNEGVYEVIETPKVNADNRIERDKDGAIIYEKRAAFVQKFNVNEYKKAEAKMYEELGTYPEKVDKPTAEQKKARSDYFTKRNTWYKENTQPKSQEEINEIIAEKTREKNAGFITQEEFDQWQSRSMTVVNGQLIYTRDLAQPADKYINTKWLNLYDKDGKPKNKKGEYHQYLTEKYFEAQEKLPESQRPGYILPSIEKTDLERMRDNGIKDVAANKLKELAKVQSYDTQFTVADLTEQGAKILPVHYTQYMDVNNVSLDLARSLLMFSSMANRYDAMNSINSEITLFKTIIGKREVIRTNSKGEQIMDAFLKRRGYTEFVRQNNEANGKKHLDAFIDMVVYGEMQKAEDIGGYSFAKIANAAMGFSALTSIAADLLKGVANNLQANTQIIIEAIGGEFFNTKNYLKGTAEYAQALPGFLGDFGKPVSTSFGGELTMLYDPIQGDFKDHYGNKVSASTARRLFRTNTLFWNQYFGEHEAQVSMMFAMMDATKVIDNETGNEITLLQAHKKYKGKEIFEKTNYTEKKRQDFQNQLHALNKRIHGVYNDFDKGTLQRLSMGRLLTMYRKHLVPGYKRRFKKMSMDQELGSPTEGYYRTFWNKFIKDTIRYKLNIMEAWSGYTPFQKSQIKKVIGEITLIVAFTVIAALLTVDDDEEDKYGKKKKQKDMSYINNFILYQAIRMRSETAAYISPIDILRIVKSPTAMTSSIERAIRLLVQILPHNITEDYERDTGVWKKGDNKAWAKFLRFMGYSGYNLTPDQAVKSFEFSIIK
tara:strand:- start:412 stop:3813 length:3402 start_codon:yes stop_codon:yes gene_type:complete